MPQRLEDETWEEFCDRIAATRAPVSWRWAAVWPNGERWGLIALVVEVGPLSPPETGTDRYPKTVVVVEELDAGDAARRLRRLTASEKVGDPEVAISVQHNAVLHRVWGTEKWGLTPVGWPRVVFDGRSGLEPIGHGDPGESLTAPGMSFYPSLETAVAERVLCVAPGRIHMTQLAPVSVRLIDIRGRIAALLADGENMQIVLEEGSDGSLEGFHLRLAWRAEFDEARWSRSDRVLSGAETLALDTDGVPAELFASLIDPGGEQIDLHAFDRRLQIEVQDPETLEASVDRWVKEGEHARLEYKQELNRGANRSFAETVAAFANGDGGEILIGIGDDGTVIGWTVDKPLDRVTNVIADLVSETPAFQAFEVSLQEKPIVVVRVAPSPPGRRPHMVGDHAMIRVNATTRRAGPAEIRNLIAKFPDGDPNLFPPVSGPG